MTREEFRNRVSYIVEVEYEDGGRSRKPIQGSRLKGYLDRVRKAGDVYISDIDYNGHQADEEVAQILKAADAIWMDGTALKMGLKSLDEAIDWFLKDAEVLQTEEVEAVETAETAKKAKEPAPKKRVWTEEEIKVLVQTNDKVLYGAIRKMYDQQTADEQGSGETKHRNGVGFNGADARIMSSFAEFLNRTGFLTPKQRAVARRKLVKYNRQLTRLANA